MNKNLTELVLVVDCSSSMSDIKQEAEVEINKLLKKQNEKEGECRLTLVEFSSEPNLVHSNTSLDSLDGYKMNIGGMTAMNDGIGLAIDSVGDRLAKTPEDQRPGLVFVVVVTDGMENCSRKYNSRTIKQKIKTQTDEFSWVFDYLCNDPMSAKNGTQLGFGDVTVTNKAKTQQMYCSLDAKMGRMRKAVSRGASSVEVQSLNSYTQEEQESMS